MYGHVKEKTIWSYWYHPETCPSSEECVLPTGVELCSKSVDESKGAFDYRLLRMDEVKLYVSDLELPSVWRHLQPELQKDALMNALLARYGGVAIDAGMCLARPIDGYWDEMVLNGASFMGYDYRSQLAEPKPGPAWLLMSRREGIFRTAASLQAAGKPLADSDLASLPRSSFGEDLLASVLQMFGCSLPNCSYDGTLKPGKSCLFSGPARNDYRVLLRDPREGPVLDLVTLGNGSSTSGPHRAVAAHVGPVHAARTESD